MTDEVRDEIHGATRLIIAEICCFALLAFTIAAVLALAA